QATIDSTRSRGPSKTAVTDPSRSLHTQPARPRDDARALVSERKNTPCTCPLTRTDALLVSVVPLLADERHEPHGNRLLQARALRACSASSGIRSIEYTSRASSASTAAW